jgi:hypothetical protein
MINMRRRSLQVALIVSLIISVLLVPQAGAISYGLIGRVVIFGIGERAGDICTGGIIAPGYKPPPVTLKQADLSTMHWHMITLHQLGMVSIGISRGRIRQAFFLGLLIVQVMFLFASNFYYAESRAITISPASSPCGRNLNPHGVCSRTLLPTARS